MNRHRYQILTNVVFWIFCLTLFGTIIGVPTHSKGQTPIWVEFLAVACLLALLIWMLLVTLSNVAFFQLPPAPTQYRLRVESSNLEIKYILESKKPGSGVGWRTEGVFEEMEKAIERQQELEDRQIKKVQIIKL